MEIVGWLYGVYHSNDPKRCRYVGITTVSIKGRAYGHWSNALREDGKVYYGPMKSWLKKHREERDQVEFRELSTFTCVEELKAAEISKISEMRKIGQADLNLTDGGEGGNGWKHTEESKRKLSEAFSGEKNPMYGKDRKELMAYAMTFKGPVTDEMKENLSEKMTTWWEENPDRREEYSERVKLHWRRGLMPEMTRERAIEAVRSRESTLLDDVVKGIRELRRQGYSYKQISAETGEPEHQVRSALGCRGAYSWVEGGQEPEDWRMVKLRRDGLTPEDIHGIRKMFDSGSSNTEILSKHYPYLKRAKVQHITSRRGYKWIPEA